MNQKDETLFQTLETLGKDNKKIIADDGLFLQQLSNWIITKFGNVNVAQRLNIMAIKWGERKRRKVGNVSKTNRT